MSKDRNEDGKEFTFINEQILSKKKNRMKKMVGSITLTMILAVLFGVVARVAFIASDPWINRLLGNDTRKKQVAFQSGTEYPDKGVGDFQESEPMEDYAGEEDTLQRNPGLESPTQTDDPEASIDGEEKDETEATTIHNTYYIEKKIAATVNDYVSMYSELRRIANEASKSIVTITRVQANKDVLNNEYEVETKAPGLIIADNGVELFILISYQEIKDATTLIATFSDDVEIRASLVDYDETTGLGIVAVQLEDIPEYTMKEVVVATLGESYWLSNGTPILAIGAVNGVDHSFDFGIVTSCSVPWYVVDMKLDLFYTNIMISSDGLGYMLSLDGAIVGIVTNTKQENTTEPICAVLGVSKVKKLIERMINGDERIYVGVIAEDVPDKILVDAGVNSGVYVSEVISKSPAYVAGIQSGDIINTINGLPVGGVNQYVNILEQLTYKEEIKVSIARFQNGVVKTIETAFCVGKTK